MKRFFATLCLTSLIFSFAQEKKGIDSTALQKEIEELTLNGKKKLIERKADRLIFNVEQSVAAQGGDAIDAIDALKVTPNLRVVGDKITLIGKNSVQVMVNDKIVPLSGEELQNYLKSIPSGNIQKIEVITTPPAKYDAEGNSGLINIQLKNTPKDSWNATLRSTYRQATYATLAENGSFSYQKNKLSVLASLSYTHDNSLYTNDIHYHYPTELWNQDMFLKTRSKNWGALLNLRYDMTKKSSMGVQFLGSFIDRNSVDSNDNIAYNYSNNSINKLYKTYGNSSTQPNHISLNLNFNHKLDDKGKTFSIDADYFALNSARNNVFQSDMQDFVNHSLTRLYSPNYSKQQIENYTLKTDWEFPYTWTNLSFGAKANSTQTKNIVDTRFFDADTQALTEAIYDNFEYTENTQALYLSANRKWGEKWEAKAGLRAEFTQTKAHSITLNEVTHREFLKLFPTLYLAYNANENHTFTLNYSRRIGRPNFWHLNPAREYDGPKSYTTGNPFLQPSFTDNYQLGYSYNSLLNTDFYVSKTQGAFNQVTRHNTQDYAQIFRYENAMDHLFIGGSLSVTYSPFRFWETSTGVNVSYAESTPYNQEIYLRHYSGWSGITYSDNTFTLNKGKTLLALLNYWYSFPNKGVGIQEANTSLDIGFRYLALDKKLTIGLNFEDIFRSQSSTFHERHYGSGVDQSFLQYYDSQLVRLSLSYKFRNDKISLKQRTTGNEEERNRAQ